MQRSDKAFTALETRPIGEEHSSMGLYSYFGSNFSTQIVHSFETMSPLLMVGF